MSGSPSQGKGPPRQPPTAVAFMGIGVQFAATILGSLFLGRWLDARLGTSPWLLLLGVFAGFGLSVFWILRRLARGADRKP